MAENEKSTDRTASAATDKLEAMLKLIASGPENEDDEELLGALEQAREAVERHVKHSKIVEEVDKDFDATGRTDPGRI